MLSYLLGFPTPVVEIFLVLLLLFVVLSVYFGTQFEGMREGRGREVQEDVETEEVAD